MKCNNALNSAPFDPFEVGARLNITFEDITIGG